MDFSEDELVAIQAAIEASIKEAKLHLGPTEDASASLSSADTDLRVLLSIKDKLTNRIPGEVSRPSDAPGAKQNFYNRHILLVDDNESIRKHMTLILKKHGFNKFDEAEDGYVAIEKIKKKAIPYDLILCDMNMPVISGIDVLRSIKEEDRWSKIPFIMVTTESNKEILVKAIKAGVSDFVAKPVNEELLMQKIATLLQ